MKKLSVLMGKLMKGKFFFKENKKKYKVKNYSSEKKELSYYKRKKIEREKMKNEKKCYKFVLKKIVKKKNSEKTPKFTIKQLKF